MISYPIAKRIPLTKHHTHEIKTYGLSSLLLFLALVSFFLVLSSHEASGFIEIKKYKVINSPKVCGEKMCSPVDEQKAKKGLSVHDTKICGDKPCDTKNGVPRQQTPTKEPAPVLKVDSFALDQRDFLLFKGQGWHNLHNVEIKITGQTFETSIRSQTDDRGNLHMPWPIPESFVDGTYNISATDGFNSLEIALEIKTSGSVSVSTHKADKCTSTKAPVDWSGCDLYGRTLANVDLRMAKLKKANLYGASLQNNDLSGADLTGAVLKKANLDGAKLVGADLSNSSMIDAKIRGADLSNAKIRYAKLYEADFTKSNLSNVDFTGSGLSYANLSFTNLQGANLESAGLWATNLNHCKNHPICER